MVSCVVGLPHRYTLTPLSLPMGMTSYGDGTRSGMFWGILRWCRSVLRWCQWQDQGYPSGSYSNLLWFPASSVFQAGSCGFCFCLSPDQYFPSHRVVGWADLGDSHHRNKISNAWEGYAHLYGVHTRTDAITWWSKLFIGENIYNHKMIFFNERTWQILGL